jgi:hypothetical protein
MLLFSPIAPLGQTTGGNNQTVIIGFAAVIALRKKQLLE